MTFNFLSWINLEILSMEDIIKVKPIKYLYNQIKKNITWEDILV